MAEKGEGVSSVLERLGLSCLLDIHTVLSVRELDLQMDHISIEIVRGLGWRYKSRNSQHVGSIKEPKDWI